MFRGSVAGTGIVARSLMAVYPGGRGNIWENSACFQGLGGIEKWKVAVEGDRDLEKLSQREGIVMLTGS